MSTIQLFAGTWRFSEGLDASESADLVGDLQPVSTDHRDTLCRNNHVPVVIILCDSVTDPYLNQTSAPTPAWDKHQLRPLLGPIIGHFNADPHSGKIVITVPSGPTPTSSPN
ncbi:hypothetical protein AVEN_20645-1 [Araneus ventricosus]|uniref:Uncharacterized protein n=1 Tax=Araneus ventricosus TaxID=182803 RepID=A0A4Y2IWT8_ARAVE|nr:hypothetical protein AVEN_20645-1 [Araneus ventricosus]